MKNHNTCFAFQTGKYRVMNLILDNENFPVGKIADSSNSSDSSVTIDRPFCNIQHKFPD